MLALAASSLSSCAESESPAAIVERLAGEVQPATLPGDARLLDITPARGQGPGYEVTWRLTTRLAWDEFTRSVRAALTPRMQVRRQGPGLLSLQRTTDADLYRLDLRPVSAEGGELIVQAVFTAEPW